MKLIILLSSIANSTGCIHLQYTTTYFNTYPASSYPNPNHWKTPLPPLKIMVTCISYMGFNQEPRLIKERLTERSQRGDSTVISNMHSIKQIHRYQPTCTMPMHKPSVTADTLEYFACEQIKPAILCRRAIDTPKLYSL